MLLTKEDIYFNVSFKNKKQAMKTVGSIMVDKGWVERGYIKSIIKRDKLASVAIGNGLAIVHGQSDGAHLIHHQGMVFIKLDQPLQWDGNSVLFIAGLALNGDQQLEALQNFGLSFANNDAVQKFYQKAKTTKDVFQFLKTDNLV